MDGWDSGGRGRATDLNAVATFCERIEKAIAYATVLKPKQLTCIIGKRIEGVSHSSQWKVLIKNLRNAADQRSVMDINLFVEVFNDYDNPNSLKT